MSRAVAERDAGLRRLGRLTRQVAAGAIGLTVAFVGLAARSTPGKAAARAPESVSTDDVSDGAAGAVDPPTTAVATVPSSVPAPARRRAATRSTAATAAPVQRTVAPFVPPTQPPRQTHHAPVVVSGGS